MEPLPWHVRPEELLLCGYYWGDGGPAYQEGNRWGGEGPVRAGKAAPPATLPCPARRGDTRCWEEASVCEIAVSETAKASQHPVCRGAGHGVRAGRDLRNAPKCSFMLQMGKLRPKDSRLA